MTDNDDDTPLDKAINAENTEVVEYLKSRLFSSAQAGGYFTVVNPFQLYPNLMIDLHVRIGFKLKLQYKIMIWNTLFYLC